MDRVSAGIDRARDRYSATETIELAALGAVLFLLVNFLRRSPVTGTGVGIGIAFGVALVAADLLPRSRRVRWLGTGLVGTVLFGVVVALETTPARDGALVGALSVTFVVVAGATVGAWRRDRDVRS